MTTTTNLWPELPLAEWKDTYETLHMWTQIVGKIRLALTHLEIIGGILPCMYHQGDSRHQLCLTTVDYFK